VSVYKPASALDRLQRARSFTAYGFAITTVITVVSTVLHDANYLRPAYHGFALNLWSLTGATCAVLWCAYHMYKRIEERERRTEEIRAEIAALSEAARVAGWAVAMEQSNIRNINRR
jgi:hypothetical protein